MGIPRTFVGFSDTDIYCFRLMHPATENWLSKGEVCQRLGSR